MRVVSLVPLAGFGVGACFAGGVLCLFWCGTGVLLLLAGMLWPGRGARPG